MHLFFGGSEVPSWRKMLAEENVEHVSLSFIGLSRRTKFSRPWLLKDKYPDEQHIFLDSGAYTVNNADAEKYSQAELRDLAARYMHFVEQNLDRVGMVSEFDSLALGPAWVEAMREDFWDDLPEDKFLPIWHGDSLDALDSLCQRYARVGITQSSLDGSNLAPRLNGMVQKYGTKLHGIAMTKPDVMSAIKWDSVASTSWISPSQYGDTIVWTGNELKRYPKKYKEQARKRHRTYFDSKGFDSTKIEADDTHEVLRLSIWSWQQVVENLERHSRSDEVAATQPESDAEVNAENVLGEVVMQSLEPHNSVSTAMIFRDDSERRVLPVMGLLKQREQVIGEGGETEEREVELVQSRSQSMRMCDSCFLKDKCPAFKPKTNCAYDIPVVVKTRDQMLALQNALIEMQSQRVMFMQMAEDMEGGYADPNLSNEIDRLQKLIKVATELASDSFSIKFEAKGQGNGHAGMISRLFGNDAGNRAQALPVPIPADRILESSDIMDAEVVEVQRPY